MFLNPLSFNLDLGQPAIRTMLTSAVRFWLAVLAGASEQYAKQVTFLPAPSRLQGMSFSLTFC